MTLDARLIRLERAAPARELDADAIRARIVVRLDGIRARLTDTGAPHVVLEECSIAERFALGDVEALRQWFDARLDSPPGLASDR